MRATQTKRSRIVNQKTLIVTVDIGKTMNMGYWRTPDGSAEAKPFEFFNSGWGFKKFWVYISRAMKQYDLKEAVIGFESTGAYGELLVHFLRKKKAVRLVQVNPSHTKRLKELQGNSPNKTDKKDPKVIADIIELGHTLTVVVPEGPAAELRRLTNARVGMVEKRIALSNRLQDLVFITFPEFLKVMKGIKTKSAQYILKHLPSPKDIIECGIEDLALKLKKVSSGNLGKERAEKLNKEAKQSAGIQEGQESILFEIKETVALIESYENLITKVEKRMSYYLKQIPYSKFILSIRGIGEVTAAGLIGEVGDFTKFNSIVELEKIAGLDIYEISSGKHKGNRRISKRGRPLLRKILYLAAINMVSKKGVFHEWYQKAVKRGMVKMKAIIALSRKLLGIIFALIRNQSQYVIDYSKPQALREAA